MNFPEHKCGLYLKHNEHRDSYEPIRKYLDDGDGYFDISGEDRKICIETDEVWVLQWYPNSPTSFFCVAAATLERVLALALEQ